MIKFEHLLGQTWVHGSADCYGLFRQFYMDNWKIDLPDFARPPFWWIKNPELDLIRTNFRKVGFIPVDVTHRTIRPGDGILMQLGERVTVLNHCAMYIGKGWFIHHPFRATSCKDLWTGEWRNRTMAVVRHPQVIVDDRQPSFDIVDLLPKQKRDHYRAILAGIRR